MMTREEFRCLLEQGIVVLDGATGTNLQQAGMPVGVCPEQWILEHKEACWICSAASWRQGRRSSMRRPLRETG